MKEKPDRTLLLTTHYMAEADELCDRLAIIDKGKVLACDTPANLKRQAQQYPIYELSLAPGTDGVATVSALPGAREICCASDLRWAVVTSGVRRLASAHLAAAGARLSARMARSINADR